MHELYVTLHNSTRVVVSRVCAHVSKNLISRALLRDVPSVCAQIDATNCLPSGTLSGRPIPQSSHAPPTRNPRAKCNLINRTFAFRRYGRGGVARARVSRKTLTIRARAARRASLVIKFLSVSALSAPRHVPPTISRGVTCGARAKNAGSLRKRVPFSKTAYVQEHDARTRPSLFTGKTIPKNTIYIIYDSTRCASDNPRMDR